MSVKRYELVGVNGPNSYTGTCGKCQMVEEKPLELGEHPNTYQYVLASDFDAACAERDWNREELRRTQQEFREARETNAALAARVERLEGALRKAESRLSDIAENTDCWGVYQMAIHARQGAEEARAALSPQAEKEDEHAVRRGEP